MPSSVERVLEAVALHPAVDHVVARLVDDERGAEVVQDRRRLPGLLGVVGGDAGVERAAGADGGVEGAHRLLERRVGVEAVGVEDVDVVEAHALQALVERGEQVLAAAPLAVGAVPHAVAGLGRDDELVAVAGEVGAQELAEGGLGRARRRAVVVGEVEVGDAGVEGGADDGALGIVGGVPAEVVPEAERDRRELQAGAAAVAIGHAAVVAGFGGEVGHRSSFRRGVPGGLGVEGLGALAGGLEIDEGAHLPGLQDRGHHVDGVERKVERAARRAAVQDRERHVGEAGGAVVGEGGVRAVSFGTPKGWSHWVASAILPSRPEISTVPPNQLGSGTKSAPSVP